MYLRKRDTSNAFKTYVLYKQYSDSLLKKIKYRDLLMPGSDMKLIATIRRLNC